MSGVPAFLLAGGLGTRLRPFTEHTPKPMLPLLTEPILFGWLRRLRASGITDIHVLAGQDIQPFAAAREFGGRLGLRVALHAEPIPLHSAGAVRAAATVGASPLLVINGDIVTDAPLDPLLDDHRRTGADATLLGVRHQSPSEFGVIQAREDRITSFIEKPAGAAPGWIYAGVCVLGPRVLRQVPRATPYSLERDVFANLAGANLHLRLHASRAGWADVGTPRTFLEASHRVMHGKLNWPYPSGTRPHGNEVTVHPSARVHPTARLVGPAIIGRHAIVAERATVGPLTIIGDRAHVAPGARVSHSTLFAGASCRQNARVHSALLDDHHNLRPVDDREQEHRVPVPRATP